MNALEVRTIVGALMSPLEKAIERAAAPLLARIEALEGRALVEGPPGRDGIDGKDVDPEATRDMVVRMVAEAAAALPPAEAGPPGKDGEAGPAGKDGKDVDPEEVKQLVMDAVAALPPAEPGPPGQDGAPGRDGAGVHPDIVKGMVQKLVGEAVAAIPPAESGQDGVPGRDGRDGQPGPPGPPGRDGIDGKDGLAGKDGRDGLSAEDMSVTTPDDGRSFVVTLARGGEVISQNVVTTALPLDRGVWKEGSYTKGDGVTLGGEYWIAKRDTKVRPIYSPGGDWRLAVKKGRDGKDGRAGKPGEPGPEGKPGRDLTQLWGDGTKT